jgi:hypothetical protein
MERPLSSVTLLVVRARVRACPGKELSESYAHTSGFFIVL